MKHLCLSLCVFQQCSHNHIKWIPNIASTNLDNLNNNVKKSANNEAAENVNAEDKELNNGRDDEICFVGNNVNFHTRNMFFI